MVQAECASLREEIRIQIEDVCRRRLPYETCGVLFGRCLENRIRIEGFAVVRNAAPDARKAFSFDPEDWIRTCYEAHNNGREIVGFFHSHPNGSVLPSGEDVKGRPPAGTYWIVGLKESGCDIQAYLPDRDCGWRPLRMD